MRHARLNTALVAYAALTLWGLIATASGLWALTAG